MKLIKEICLWNGARGLTDFNHFHEYKMLDEELCEYASSGTVENMAKELADLIFVAVGSLYKLTGADPKKVEKIIEAVVNANNQKPAVKVEGKVIKGDDYICPEKIIEEVLHED